MRQKEHLDGRALALPVVHGHTAVGTTYENDPVLGIVSEFGLSDGWETAARAYVGLLAATIVLIATNAGLICMSRLSCVARRAPPAAGALRAPAQAPPHAVVHDLVLQRPRDAPAAAVASALLRKVQHAHEVALPEWLAVPRCEHERARPGWRSRARLVPQQHPHGRPHVTSTYRWQGTVEVEPEKRMHMHTRLHLVDQVVEFVKQRHPYDVPNVTAIPLVAGNPDYLAWIEAETVHEAGTEA